MYWRLKKGRNSPPSQTKNFWNQHCVWVYSTNGEQLRANVVRSSGDTRAHDGVKYRERENTEARGVVSAVPVIGMTTTLSPPDPHGTRQSYTEWENSKRVRIKYTVL